jgi:uncharacterized protein
MITEALEHVVRGIVDHPDDVTVQTRKGRSGLIYEVRVNPDDIGRVIGRSGRTATAVRTVIGAITEPGGRPPRIDFVETR